MVAFYKFEPLRPLVASDFVFPIANRNHDVRLELVAGLERVAAGEKLETKIVSIKSVQIDQVSVEGNTATVTVEFISDQIKVVRDSEENIVDGDPDTIESLTDLWTFNRDVTSTNPNWILTRTETPTEG